MASSFIKVRCPDCKNEQISFEKAAMKVKCKKCGKILIEPSSSRAKLNAKVVETFTSS